MAQNEEMIGRAKLLERQIKRHGLGQALALLHSEFEGAGSASGKEEEEHCSLKLYRELSEELSKRGKAGKENDQTRAKDDNRGFLPQLMQYDSRVYAKATATALKYLDKISNNNG